MVGIEELIQTDKDQVYKLATVVELFENGTAKLQFYGEDVMSEKMYSYLASYEPTLNDIVLLMRISDTYIILGKVMGKEDTPLDYLLKNELGNYIDTDALNTALANYATKDLLGSYATAASLINYATKSSLIDYAKKTDLNNYADYSHTHTGLKNGSYQAYLYEVNYVPHFVPSTTTMALGQPSNKWKEVYATTGTINTSDRRQKKDIRPFGEKFIKFFKLIKPVLYKFKDGTNGRDHGGYISQDIEKAMAKSGLESNDFAGFIKSPIYSKKGKIKGYEYGLRYSEFIALNTFMIQQLISRVEVLERMIKEGEKN